MDKTPVSQWMTPHPYTIAPNAFIVDAYHIMKEHRIRRLPVVEGAKLVGIVTLSDVRGAAPLGIPDMLEINYVLSQIKVERVMSRKVITVEADAPVQEAARLLLEHKFGGLPVVKDGELVGIISEADIFRLVIQQEENLPV
ncbi:MAG TPA: CBS domain-containing protein [Anaerolineales bacterium]|nr:CBS domain-containing protein [Anaerolineales bacterium]